MTEQTDTPVYHAFMFTPAPEEEEKDMPRGLVPGGSSGPGKKKESPSVHRPTRTPIAIGSRPDPPQHSQLKTHLPVPTPEPLHPLRSCDIGMCNRDAVTTCAECQQDVCTVHFFSTGTRFFCTSCYKDEYSIHDQQAQAVADTGSEFDSHSSDSATDPSADTGQNQTQAVAGLRLQAPPQRFDLSAGSSEDETEDHRPAIYQGVKEPPIDKWDFLTADFLEHLPEEVQEELLEEAREARKKEPTVYVDVSKPSSASTSLYSHSSAVQPGTFTSQEAQQASAGQVVKVSKYNPLDLDFPAL